MFKLSNGTWEATWVLHFSGLPGKHHSESWAVIWLQRKVPTATPPASGSFCWILYRGFTSTVLCEHNLFVHSFVVLYWRRQFALAHQGSDCLLLPAVVTMLWCTFESVFPGEQRPSFLLVTHPAADVLGQAGFWASPFDNTRWFCKGSDEFLLSSPRGMFDYF